LAASLRELGNIPRHAMPYFGRSENMGGGGDGANASECKWKFQTCVLRESSSFFIATPINGRHLHSIVDTLPKINSHYRNISTSYISNNLFAILEKVGHFWSNI